LQKLTVRRPIFPDSPPEGRIAVIAGQELFLGPDILGGLGLEQLAAEPRVVEILEQEYLVDYLASSLDLVDDFVVDLPPVCHLLDVTGTRP
jgi:hypothetical protein